MKVHFIFVEEDGTISWAKSWKTVWKGKGSVHTDAEVVLGDWTWRVVRGRDELRMEAFDKNGKISRTKFLALGGLYKITPRHGIRTIVLNSVRGKRGFEEIPSSDPAEPRSTSAPLTAVSG